MRVLIVEDDENMRLAIRGSLRGAGFAVDAVGDLPAADEALWVNSYDGAVFDRMLPSGDALHYVRAQRSRGSTVPVLFLTALDGEADRVAGLSTGDGYLVKPFAMDELVARVIVLCGRHQVSAARRPVLRCGDVELDAASRQVRRAGVLLTLTGREFAVLELLMSRAGAPVRRRELLDHGWDEMIEPATNVLEQVVMGLRRKLGEPQVIQTVPGVGYLIYA